MNKHKETQIDIYHYFDYREYLNAVYTVRKQNERGFSHRLFSYQAGITSPNYLFRVLKGERTLNGDYIEKFCNALHLTGNEKNYFTTLVYFNNETESSTKEKYLQSLLSIRYRKGIHRIDDKKLQFFSKWYYPVIRELAVIIDFREDFNLLARSCLPRITAQQCKNAVTYLLKNGFLEKNKKGMFKRSDPIISSGNEVKSVVLRNYHKQTLNQSIDALNTIAPEHRDISSVTLSVSKKTYFEMKKEIQNFRKRLLAMAKEDTNPEMVCLAGFQLYPRSRIDLE
jgi:uncharacterized protein (TIGR02147 family)